MERSELASKHIGCRVIYKEDIYNKISKRWKVLTTEGIIDSLLIDIHFGAYGFRVKSKTGDHNFIFKDALTDNLIGRNLNDLILVR